MYELKNIYWSHKTLIFYIIIGVASYILLSQKKIRIKIGNNKRDYNLWLIITFIFLMVILGFRTTGRDINYGYYINFNSANSVSEYRDQTVEFGFIFFNVIIKKIFNNYSIFIFISSLMTLIPVYYVINKYSNNININYSILLYTSIYFISGFSPMRQYLSASICLLAYDSMIEKKKIRAFLFIILASFFHVSSLFMVFPFLFTFNKYFGKKIIILSTFSILIVIYLLRNSITGFLPGRYAKYTVFTNITLGMRWIAYYLPIFFLLIRTFKYEKDIDNRNATTNISIISTGFLFEILGYVISILGRLESITLPLIIILPYYLKMEKSKFVRIFEKVFLFFYCGLRFWLFINDNYYSQDLMPYTNLLW